ncbi:hypothetical protein HYR69_00230, partial [Candidatus Sumerlaeota bacterium]|nr:hypothetical protein [Candidatus Sumerlaeota bacterium]
MIKSLTTENPSPKSATSNGRGVIVRPAEMRDVDEIYELIVAATRVSMVLPRDRDSILHHLQGFRVAESEGRVIGCGVLHVMAPVLGEIRSLA